jgi:hypothetical protein
MTWRPTRPRSSDTISDIPELCQDNFDAIEDIIGIEHGTFGGTDPTSGVHKVGQSSVVYLGPAASAVQLESDYDLPTGAMAVATDIGELWFYRGASQGWDAVGASAGEWSRCCWALSANQGLTDESLTDINFDTLIFDDRTEYNPSTHQFTARASGWYWVKAQIALVASGESLYTTCSGTFLPNADLYTTSTPSSGSYNWACIDEFPENVNLNDYVYLNGGISGADYYGIQSDNLPINAAGVTADSEYGGNVIAYICDDNSTTYWTSSTQVPSGDISYSTTCAWAMVDFGAGIKRIITNMGIEANDPGAGARVRNWSLYATSDTAVASTTPPSTPNGWTLLGQSSQVNNSQMQTYRLNNATGYRYYALAVYSIFGTALGRVQVEEWQLLSCPWHVPAGSTRMVMWLMATLDRYNSPLYNPVYHGGSKRLGILTSGGSSVEWTELSVNPTSITTVYEDLFGYGISKDGDIAEYWTPTLLNAMSGIAVAFVNFAGSSSKLYSYAGRMWWDPPNQTVELVLGKSGSVVASKTHSYWLRSQSTAGVQTFDVSSFVYMAPGDYIDLKVRGNFISGLTDTISGDPSMTYMHVHKLGGAGR